jgi:hypothetical protein
MSSIYRVKPEEEFEDIEPEEHDIEPELGELQIVEELPDGSTVYERIMSPDEGPEASEDAFGGDAFYENLAEKLEKSKLRGLASELLDEISQDVQSRQDWETANKTALKYLGTKIEESRTVPFVNACSAFDTTLSTALFDFYSIARAALFPAAGPAKSQIIGVPTDQTQDEGERVKMFLNFFLTQKDKGYYPDSERLLLYIGLFGSGFRKVWQDLTAEEPRARSINPQDLIIDIDTTDILSSGRITHRQKLSDREIMLREEEGFFIKGGMPDEEDDDDDDGEIEGSRIDEIIRRIDGVSIEEYEKKSLHSFYECTIDISPEKVEPKEYLKLIDNKKIPRPYIITISGPKRIVVSIKRNWKPEDNKFKKNQHYVLYNYLPGFGIYGTGLGALLCSNQIVLTSVLRQLIDAGTLKNFPGGIRISGMRFEKNNRGYGPGEFLEVETGGARLQDSIMLNPYAEPSQVLAALRQELKQDAKAAGFSGNQELPDFGKNTPVGTTIAMLDIATQAQSSIMRSLYNSLSEELALLKNLFGEYLGDEQYPFAVPGKEAYVMRQDFNDKVNIVPVADPNVLTTTHRLIMADALVQSATAAPELHNLREVYKRRYEAMNVQNIDEILPKPDEPKAMDPVTENTYVLLGKQIRVSQTQDHQSHLVVHRKFQQENLMNPAVSAPIALHIQVHEALEILKELQQMQMQQGMPPIQIPEGQEEQVLTIPEIQNELARKDAEKATAEQQQQQQQQAEMAAKQIDPMQAAMAEIEQRREASYLKDEESKLRAETESFKAQLNHEAEMEKLEAEREIASEKNETSLVIEHLKHDTKNPQIISE